MAANFESPNRLFEHFLEPILASNVIEQKKKSSVLHIEM